MRGADSVCLKTKFFKVKWLGFVYISKMLVHTYIHGINNTISLNRTQYITNLSFFFVLIKKTRKTK